MKGQINGRLRYTSLANRKAEESALCLIGGLNIFLLHVEVIIVEYTTRNMVQLPLTALYMNPAVSLEEKFIAMSNLI